MQAIRALNMVGHTVINEQEAAMEAVAVAAAVMATAMLTQRIFGGMIPRHTRVLHALHFTALAPQGSVAFAGPVAL